MIIGIILVVGSAWWVLRGSSTYLGRSGLADLATLLNGAIPVIVFVVGIFIVWLELDELKIERELAREEKKARKKK
jgi:hypothetical protein